MPSKPSSVSVQKLSEFPFHLGFMNPDTSIRTERFGSPDSDIRVSVVMPVHNQGPIIGKVLEHLQLSMTLDYELILILDDCTDRTRQEVDGWLDKALSQAILHEIVVVTTDVAVYETISDSIGFHYASSSIYLEVQADMILNDPGFDARLREALDTMPDLVAVSGRGVDTFAACTPIDRLRQKLAHVIRRAAFRRGIAYRATRLEFFLFKGVGRLGPAIELVDRTEPHTVWVGHTVMRGPLALSAPKLGDLGGLDTSRFFLGDDDHNLCRRAWVERRWRAAYMPVRFISPLDAGSTRKKRDPRRQMRHVELDRAYSEAQKSVDLLDLDIEWRKKPPRLETRSTFGNG
ncbi:Glycosyltransferase 2-like [Klenkia terrae]|nr:Glycosyltransferase 2-like [Klenkia terrae]